VVPPAVPAQPVVPPVVPVVRLMQDLLVCRHCQRGILPIDEVARMIGTMTCETCQGPLLAYRM
jgi:hypothetical protein